MPRGEPYATNAHTTATTASAARRPRLVMEGIEAPIGRTARGLKRKLRAVAEERLELPLGLVGVVEAHRPHPQRGGGLAVHVVVVHEGAVLGREPVAEALQGQTVDRGVGLSHPHER